MHEEKYKQLLKKRREWYKSIEKVFCGILCSYAIFNAKGFRHLIYDGRGELRPLSDRMRRLNLLPHAIRIICEAERVDENRHEGNVEFWSFRNANIIKGYDIVVVLKKVGNGNIAFCSIM